MDSASNWNSRICPSAQARLSARRGGHGLAPTCGACMRRVRPRTRSALHTSAVGSFIWGGNARTTAACATARRPRRSRGPLKTLADSASWKNSVSGFSNIRSGLRFDLIGSRTMKCGYPRFHGIDSRLDGDVRRLPTVREWHHVALCSQVLSEALKLIQVEIWYRYRLSFSLITVQSQPVEWHL